MHHLLICTTCASVWENGHRKGTSGGEALWSKLQDQYKNWDLQAQVSLHSVECLSACSHACAVAFVSPGKHTYVFGDLPHDPEEVEATATDILNCAEIFLHKPDGLMSWSDRPNRLKKGVMARIPPI
jgi:predicted metal-binding protein